MRFDVRFVHHVEAVFVAKAIEFRRVRIVRRAYRVYVQTLHQFQVLAHILFAHRRPRFRMELVTVYPLQFDRLPVHQQRPRFDLYAAETHSLIDHFLSAENRQFVKVRLLRAPKLYVLCFKALFSPSLHFLSLPFELYFARRLRKILEDHLSSFALYLRFYLIILYAVPIPIQQVHVPDNPAETPLVLIFQIRRRAPFQDDYVQYVLARLHISAQVEFRGLVRNLRVAQQLPVYVRVKRAVYPLEHQTNVLFPSHFDFSSIMKDRILLFDIRRIVWERIAVIRVLHLIVSVQLHAARHRHFLP